MIRYLWTTTDSQIAGQGTAVSPDDDSYTVPPPLPSPPRAATNALLGWDEQGDLPLLQAVDDGGWTPFFTAGTGGISIPDCTAWADDGRPTPPTVTPQEDWNVWDIIGLPVKVPDPVLQPAWGWHSEEREAAITAIFPSDDSILPLLRVITPPLQSPLDRIWSFEQSDWWGGGTGTGGDVLQLQTLQTTGAMAIP
jgi:hypothetical protein